MITTAVRPRGVPAVVLRRIALPTVVVLGVIAAILDRHAGFMAVFVGVLPWLVYGTLLALPIQVLHRDVRLRAPGVAVFALGVLAISAAAWCVPVQDDGVYGRYQGVVAVRELLGRGPVDDATASPWETATAVVAAAAVIACLTLCVVTWRVQRHSRGRAVNATVVGSVLTTFATLPEPAGGTSVTRPVAPPLTRRWRPSDG